MERFRDLSEDLERLDPDGESWARAVLELDAGPELEEDPRPALLYGRGSIEAELAAVVGATR